MIIIILMAIGLSIQQYKWMRTAKKFKVKEVIHFRLRS